MTTDIFMGSCAICRASLMQIGAAGRRSRPAWYSERRMGRRSSSSGRGSGPRGWLAGLAVLTLCGWGGAAPAAAQNLPPSHANFPFTLSNAGNVVVSHPLLADLGLTPGFKQIIFGTRQGLLYVLQHQPDGSWAPAPGWPVNLGSHIASSPAVGDLDGDGIPEIVVGYGSTFDAATPEGGAKSFRRDGTLMWTVWTGPLTDRA